ncbi:MAG: glycogen synthase GlgA [Clostridia bacterium]|nr:glycogen synthase GlgA [Clostridia bacterium]
MAKKSETTLAPETKKVTAKATEEKATVKKSSEKKVTAKATTSKTTAKKVTTKKTTSSSTTKATTKKSTVAKKTATKTTAKLPKITVSEKKKVVFLGSEAAPFIATGGLADVLGSLPKALAKNGNLDVSVILPMYSKIKPEFKEKFKFLTSFNVSVSWRSQYCGVFYCEYEGVKFYFLDNEYYFKREGNIYGFYDDGERFAFFSRAALDTIARLDIYPDILHCNDWQTAASIVYLKGMYYNDAKFAKIKSIFTIHNIEYQGIFNMYCYGDIFGFPQAIEQFVEFDGNVNLMKAAIEMTDIVSTVSPTYAEEIKDSFFAHGLENIIRKNSHKLYGILNGIDVDYYNPETDKFLFKNYSANDLSGKAECKAGLQKLLGLPVRADVPVLAVISRLVSHKGLDLLRATIETLLSQDIQIVILGTGETSYENYFTHVANCFKGKCVTIIEFNQDLSRKIYSGADIFLMPSKMEPCGLSQMIASRYGTVPVVRETGGLNDSIKAYTGVKGNGFTFHDYNAHDMLYVINEAIRTFKNEDAWKDVQNRAITTDFSWKVQAGEYEKIYNI